MAKWKLPSATAATIDANTPQQREILFDRTNNRPRIGDGSTQGGNALAFKSELDEVSAALDDKLDVVTLSQNVVDTKVPVFDDWLNSGYPGLYTPDGMIFGRGVFTAADDVYELKATRLANYTGGTFGFVNNAFRAETVVSAGATAFEWTALCTMDNYATQADASENVAFYAQAKKRSTGWTWASTLELIDYLANPTTGSIGVELDMSCNGADNNNARVGLDIWARPVPASVGTPASGTVRYGLRFNAGNDGAAVTTLTDAIYFNAGAGGVITYALRDSAGNFSLSMAGAFFSKGITAGADGLAISSTLPTFTLSESDQAADAKLWGLPWIQGGVASFGPMSDALAHTVAFSINRSGVTNFAIAPTFTDAGTARTNLGLGAASAVTFGSLDIAGQIDCDNVLSIAGASPVKSMTESDQAANQKSWWLPIINGGVASFGPITDAGVITTSFTMDRSGVVNFAVSPTFTSPTGTRTNLGVGTGDSPQFTAINVGHASDTTVSRHSAGNLSIEGNLVYRAGGTDVPVADGGTGASTGPAALDNLASKFRAHKNGTNQTGLTSGAATDVTFGTEVYDVGAAFASNTWTPAAGKVHLNVGVAASGAALLTLTVAIYKNGAAFALTIVPFAFSFGGNENCYANLAVDDIANGTDAYKVVVTGTTSSGTFDVSGTTSETWFSGHHI